MQLDSKDNVDTCQKMSVQTVLAAVYLVVPSNPIRLLLVVVSISYFSRQLYSTDGTNHYTGPFSLPGFLWCVVAGRIYQWWSVSPVDNTIPTSSHPLA